ncbi:MAG: hypothetical protein M3406_10125 [Chloroflexota bacterium]|nr:hypothetical protein [Chloroflexota bacterium]
MAFSDARIIELRRITNPKGNLTPRRDLQKVRARERSVVSGGDGAAP